MKLDPGSVCYGFLCWFWINVGFVKIDTGSRLEGHLDIGFFAFTSSNLDEIPMVGLLSPFFVGAMCFVGYCFPQLGSTKARKKSIDLC